MRRSAPISSPHARSAAPWPTASLSFSQAKPVRRQHDFRLGFSDKVTEKQVQTLTKAQKLQFPEADSSSLLLTFARTPAPARAASPPDLHPERKPMNLTLLGSTLLRSLLFAAPLLSLVAPPAQAASSLPYGPNTCAAGYVWRVAVPSDLVCVTPAVRAQVAADNRQAPLRHLPGSLYCRPGYVWREAYRGDTVCVVPATREQAKADNAQALARRVLSSGPDTCVQGYVWRETVPGDHVCVTPAVRDQVVLDNAQAASRQQPNSIACLSGYVWRDAYDGDAVCVVPATRQQAHDDNARADSRRIR